MTDECSPALRPGAPDGRAPRLPSLDLDSETAEAAGVGEPTRAGTKGDTVHLDVVDRFGNMVAATPSGGWLWGAPVVPELGFCLGTRAQMFWLEEGLPNSLEPGKRPRTTLSPTLVARDGEPYLALGTPGGDQQDQWTLHTLLGHLHFGLDLQAAIDAPNHHTEAFPSSFYPRASVPRHVAVEERVGEETIAGLAGPRPRGRGVGAVVARPRQRGRTRARRRAEGSGEPARRTGLRRRPLIKTPAPRRPVASCTRRTVRLVVGGRSVDQQRHLPFSAFARELVGVDHGGVGVCVIFVEAAPGEGPSLHRAVSAGRAETSGQIGRREKRSWNRV